MKRAAIIVLLILTLPVAGLSQYKYQDNSPTVSESLRMPTGYSGGFILGLIDMSKIEMRQSYSMGFSSGGGQSGSYGMYLNNILYPINDKVILNLNLGYVHNPFASFQTPSPAAFQGRFIGSGEINFFPTENTRFQFSISNLPRYGVDPYYRFRRY